MTKNDDGKFPDFGVLTEIDYAGVTKEGCN